MAALDYNEFTRKLKATPEPPPALLLHGDEPYLMERGAELACEAWKLHKAARIVGDEAAWREVESATAASFFDSGRRAVIVHYRRAADVTADHAAGLQRWLEKPTPGCTLIVRCAFKSLPVKAPASAWDVRCDRPDEDTMRRWLRREFTKRGHNIAPDAIAAFEFTLRRAPLHLWATTIDAVSSSVDSGATVERRDLEPFLGLDLDVNAFRLCDALVEGRAAAAAGLMGEILDGTPDPLPVLGALAWAYRKLLIAKLRRLKGQNRIEVARSIGVRFRAERYVDLADRLTLEDFERVHEVLLAADGQLKLRATARAGRAIMEWTVHTLVRERAGVGAR